MSRFTRSNWVMSAVSAVALGAFVVAPYAAAQAPMPSTPGMPPAVGKDNPAAMAGAKDIIDTATGPGMTDVSTVVELIQKAGLVDTLKGPGPFTVFAPTDEAFKKLGKEKCDMLMKPENKDKLKDILLYHVHSGDAIKAADVKTMSLSTAEGKPLMVMKSDSGVMINDAKVVKTDIICSNGVIHWIDTVLMPDKPMGDKPMMDHNMGGM